MILSESGLKRRLKSELKTGYNLYAREDGQILFIQGYEWFLVVQQMFLFRSVLGLLVEHIGYIPTNDSITVQKDREPQTIIPETAEDAIRAWQTVHKETRPAEYKPTLLYTATCRLYQNEDTKKIIHIPLQGLDMMERPAPPPLQIAPDCCMWNDEYASLYLRCYAPQEGNKYFEPWKVLETIDWNNREK